MVLLEKNAEVKAISKALVFLVAVLVIGAADPGHALAGGHGKHLSLVKTPSALTEVRVQDRRPAEPGAENQGFPRRTRF